MLCGLQNSDNLNVRGVDGLTSKLQGPVYLFVCGSGDGLLCGLQNPANLNVRGVDDGSSSRTRFTLLLMLLEVVMDWWVTFWILFALVWWRW